SSMDSVFSENPKSLEQSGLSEHSGPSTDPVFLPSGGISFSSSRRLHLYPIGTGLYCKDYSGVVN
ncbi:MAG: hypothetical protein KUG56_03670, partial [Kordiimonadaceae bacterium]|nr:hypothetical protein [Kordiimonadaceae bacterium]